MKAKKKPVEKISAKDLGVDLTPRLETVKVAEPPKRVGGGKVCRFTSFSHPPSNHLLLEGGERRRAHCKAERRRHHTRLAR